MPESTIIDRAGRSTPVPSYADVEAAAARLGHRIRRTPVLELDAAELDAGSGRLVLKLEVLQHTGVFKARGALNALLRAAEAGGLPADGVVAASGGNHGAAVAWAAQAAGVAATVFVPDSSPRSKVDRIASYGATVEVVEGRYPQARAALDAWVRDRDVLDIHAYDAPDVVAGQGTLGLELAEQVPGASRALISCGGGGLYAGSAIGVAGAFPVLPVEPELCPTLDRALAAGGPTRVEVSGLAADSMGAGVAGAIAHAVADRHGVTPLLVDDEAIAAARWFLWERCRVVAEPGGSTALAALLSGATRVEDGETVLVVVSGGNHDQLPPRP